MNTYMHKLQIKIQINNVKNLNKQDTHEGKFEIFNRPWVFCKSKWPECEVALEIGPSPRCESDGHVPHFKGSLKPRF